MSPTIVYPVLVSFSFLKCTPTSGRSTGFVAKNSRFPMLSVNTTYTLSGTIAFSTESASQPLIDTVFETESVPGWDGCISSIRSICPAHCPLAVCMFDNVLSMVSYLYMADMFIGSGEGISSMIIL